MKRERLVKRARFPIFKTFTDREMEEGSFVEKKQNLVMYGPVGIGKTHMAVAAGVVACQKGYRTKFFTNSAERT